MDRHDIQLFWQHQIKRSSRDKTALKSLNKKVKELNKKVKLLNE